MFSYSNIIAKKEDKNSGVVDAIGQEIHERTLRMGRVVTVAAPPVGQKAHHPDIKSAEEEKQTLISDEMIAFEVPGANVLVVDNFLSEDECDSIIGSAGKVGFTFWAQQPHESNEEAAASNPYCREETDLQAAAHFRTAETIEGSFPSLSSSLWLRMRPCFEASNRSTVSYSPEMEHADELFERDIEGTWEAKELSKNLLVAHYPPGGHFAPHVDGTTIEGFNCRSLYTVLLYLNDVLEGGGTHIYNCEQHEVLKKDAETGRVSGSGEHVQFTVTPIKGRLAIFYHNVVHEGVAVGKGLEKYIVRGDIMYQRTPPLGDENDIKAFELYTKARELESNGQAMEAVKIFQRVRKMSSLLASVYQL